MPISILLILRMVRLSFFPVFCTNSSSLACQTSARTLDASKNIQPPEALTGGKIDIKSDVWMLGCTVSFLSSHPGFSFEITLIGDYQPDISPSDWKAPLRRIVCCVAGQCCKRNTCQARESPHGKRECCRGRSRPGCKVPEEVSCCESCE